MRRSRLLLAVAAAALAAACQYGSGPDTSSGSSSGSTSTPTAPTSPTTPTTPTDPTTPPTPAPTPTGLTYTTDIAPIMNADCVRCHGPILHDAGYNLSSYAGVMRAVSAGSASSLLIRVTQSNGIMYGELSGNRAQKAQTIHDWIVTWKAQQ